MILSEHNVPVSHKSLDLHSLGKIIYVLKKRKSDLPYGNTTKIKIGYDENEYYRVIPIVDTKY